MTYDELVKELRSGCDTCKLWDGSKCCLDGDCTRQTVMKAADAIETLDNWWKKYIECVVLPSEAAKMPRWISVKERLPEDHVRVLVCNDEGKMITAERAEDDWWHTYCAYDVDRWDALESGVITHWMPLPEPPKEET